MPPLPSNTPLLLLLLFIECLTDVTDAGPWLSASAELSHEYLNRGGSAQGLPGFGRPGDLIPDPRAQRLWLYQILVVLKPCSHFNAYLLEVSV